MKEIKSMVQLAEMLGVTRVTIGDWVKEGMPHKITGPRSYEFDWEDVLRWLVKKPHRRRWVETLINK